MPDFDLSHPTALVLDSRAEDNVRLHVLLAAGLSDIEFRQLNRTLGGPGQLTIDQLDTFTTIARVNGFHEVVIQIVGDPQGGETVSLRELADRLGEISGLGFTFREVARIELPRDGQD